MKNPCLFVNTMNISMTHSMNKTIRLGRGGRGRATAIGQARYARTDRSPSFGGAFCCRAFRCRGGRGPPPTIAPGSKVICRAAAAPARLVARVVAGRSGAAAAGARGAACNCAGKPGNWVAGGGRGRAAAVGRARFARAARSPSSGGNVAARMCWLYWYNQHSRKSTNCPRGLMDKASDF